MEGILTVRDLINELMQLPDEAPIMVAVVKYPEEFAIRIKDGELSWDESTDVECIPLDPEEISVQHGMVYLVVELEDYDEQRHVAGG